MKKLLLSLTLVSFLLFSQTGLIAQKDIVYKAKGKISADIENVNNEADPKLTGLATIAAVKKAGQQGNQMVSQLAQGMAIVTDIVQRFIQREYSFALLSGHKYMVNSCLGLKVSSGQFDLKFANPEIEITGGKFSVKLEIDKIKFSVLKVRSRPRVPDFSDPDPCHFSGKFEIGGEATDVSVRVIMDLVAVAASGTAAYCTLAFGEPVQIIWKIGGFNLRPVPNTLDNMAKEMVEDALNNGMTDLVYNRLMDAAKAVLPEYFDACEVPEKMAKDVENVSNPATAEKDPSKTHPGKWTITPNNLKGATGRILMDNPAGSKWVVYIYAMADNKYITSAAESNNKGSFTIFPGEYKITINNAPVLNVPVKKGHDTKLKCGTLDVVSEGIWYLNDETGKIYYTSGNQPTKMPLPVGTYTLKFGETEQKVVIKNGETVEM